MSALKMLAMSGQSEHFSDRLPKAWRTSILTNADQNWIGQHVFISTAQKPTPKEKQLWWYPPEPKLQTTRMPKPDDFHLHRLFLWAPHHMWQLQFKCPQVIYVLFSSSVVHTVNVKASLKFAMQLCEVLVQITVQSEEPDTTRLLQNCAYSTRHQQLVLYGHRVLRLYCVWYWLCGMGCKTHCSNGSSLRKSLSCCADVPPRLRQEDHVVATRTHPGKQPNSITATSGRATQ